MPGARGLFQEAPGCSLVSQSKCQSLEQREQWVLQLSGVLSPNSQQHLGVFFYSNPRQYLSEMSRAGGTLARALLPVNGDAPPLLLDWCSTSHPSPARHGPAASPSLLGRARC